MGAVLVLTLTLFISIIAPCLGGGAIINDCFTRYGPYVPPLPGYLFIYCAWLVCSANRVPSAYYVRPSARICGNLYTFIIPWLASLRLSQVVICFADQSYRGFAPSRCTPLPPWGAKGGVWGGRQRSCRLPPRVRQRKQIYGTGAPEGPRCHMRDEAA